MTVGRYDVPVPPKHMIFIGGGDFEAIGEKWKKYFIEAGLLTDARILDVGCGIGRMARPLTSYLSSCGEYQGLDIVKEGINWCQENITTKYPNFVFQHLNIYNKYYNPSGVDNAYDYSFPFYDNYFDFVFLTSVFTHMLPKDVSNYLSEIARVMKKNATCIISYFLLNSESARYIQQSKSAINFKYKISNDCMAANRDSLEAALAYREDFITQLYKSYNLEIKIPIRSGTWCGRQTNSGFYQDIVTAIKGGRKKDDEWRDRPGIKRIMGTFLSWVRASDIKILEIGPLDKPLLDKKTYNVKYMDYFDTDKLKESIKLNKNRNLNNVVDLDYILNGKNISEVISEKFDVIVASHVLEHLPNLFGWLREIANILTNNGKLFSVIPDKRFIFDVERPATSLGELIENDVINRVKPSPRAAFDQRYYHKNVLPRELWKDYSNYKHKVYKTFTKDQAMQLFRRAQSDYVDCHCNLLESESFKEYIEIANSFGMHDFYIRNIKETEAPYSDFIVLLELKDKLTKRQ